MTNSLLRLPLKGKKNLLAFSGGIDSSALYHLLREEHIDVDIAIVDYGLRDASTDEVAYAQRLAELNHHLYHTIRAPEFESHFECQARRFRYAWFEELIARHGYDNLLTAHQLNDRLEWFLMRLSRGAGLDELTGMEMIEKRAGYTLLRPLLAFPKSKMLDYLEEHHYPYFVDESNYNEQYERNRFRKHVSDPLIAQFGEGIKRSFDYLTSDRAILQSEFQTVFHEHDLHILQLNRPELVAKAADRTLKKLGYLLSAAQRKEIGKQASLVVGGRWAIEHEGERLWIAPYTQTPMPKSFKEQCRTLHIPPKIRPYLYREEIDLETLRIYSS